MKPLVFWVTLKQRFTIKHPSLCLNRVSKAVVAPTAPEAGDRAPYVNSGAKREAGFLQRYLSPSLPLSAIEVSLNGPFSILQ